jgi:dTDP-4-amino-4,6-dideoxygalactose transaminase
MHLQECFAYLGYEAGAFPESERAARETLALPIYPEVSEEQAKYVVNCMQTFFAQRAKHRVVEYASTSSLT